MPNKKVEELIAGLDDQVIDVVGQFVKRRKAAYEQAAIKLKNDLRDDVVRYSELLEKKKISTEDFEFLVRGRSAQLKIELLEHISVSKAKFDLVTEDVIKLVLRTTIAVVAAL
ncbi:MAG: hypothetical protein IT260_07735 [Saprospiraceae bacterium]|nr:hypothetical protein [Saprospiraceae bacterium]